MKYINNNVKKLMICTLICILTLTMQSFHVCFAESPSYWAVSDVSEAVLRGFVPKELQNNWGEEISRENFCKIVIKTLETMGFSFQKSKKIVFSDTENDAVLKAASIGLVTGTGDGKFVPNKNIRRQDAAVILYRIASLEGFPDIDDNLLIPHTWNDRRYYSDTYVNGIENSYFFSYAYDAVAFCYNTGIMSGTGNNCFSPNLIYTKEQSVLTMLRLYRWKFGILDEHDNSNLIETLPNDNRKFEYGFHTEGAYSACYKYSRDLNIDGMNGISNGGIVIRRADGSEIEIETLGNRFDYVKFLSEEYAQVSISESPNVYTVSLNEGKIIDNINGMILEDGIEHIESDFNIKINDEYWRIFSKNLDGTYIYEYQDALYFIIGDKSKQVLSPKFQGNVNLNNDDTAYIECMYGRYVMGFNSHENYICNRYGRKLSTEIYVPARSEYMSDNGSNLMITSPNPTYSTFSDDLKPGDAILYDDAGKVVNTFKNVITANFYGPVIRVLDIHGKYNYYTPSGIRIKTCLT